MSAQRKTIGFDRELHLSWLDAVAAKAAEGADAISVRRWLDEYLADSLVGSQHGGARDKTIVKLCRIWVAPPESSRSLRDSAIDLLLDADPSHRMALHWGLTIASYPFFGDVANAVGRLLALQGDVQRTGVVRRTYETWGERLYVNRATRAVWNTFLLWDTLRTTDRRGCCVGPPARHSLFPSTEAFLIEAVLHWSGGRSLPLSSLVWLPSMFPFDMSNASSIVRASDRLSIRREGSNLEMVSMRTTPSIALSDLRTS